MGPTPSRPAWWSTTYLTEPELAKEHIGAVATAHVCRRLAVRGAMVQNILKCTRTFLFWPFRGVTAQCHVPASLCDSLLPPEVTYHVVSNLGW